MTTNINASNDKGFNSVRTARGATGNPLGATKPAAAEPATPSGFNASNGNEADAAENKLSLDNVRRLPSTRFRPQVDLPEASRADIEFLIHETSLRTHSQIMRVALHLLRQVVEEERAGGRVIFEREGKNPRQLCLGF